MTRANVSKTFEALVSDDTSILFWPTWDELWKTTREALKLKARDSIE